MIYIWHRNVLVGNMKMYDPLQLRTYQTIIYIIWYRNVLACNIKSIISCNYECRYQICNIYLIWKCLGKKYQIIIYTYDKKKEIWLGIGKSWWVAIADGPNNDLQKNDKWPLQETWFQSQKIVRSDREKKTRERVSQTLMYYLYIKDTFSTLQFKI